MSGVHSNRLPAPGLFWGAYPERRPSGRQGPERLVELALARLRPPPALLIGRYRRFVSRVDVLRRGWADEGEPAQQARLRQVQLRLASEGLRGEALEQAFALVSRQCQRVLGWSPFASQLIAARAILDSLLVEMATGEGKTLAIAIASAVGALAGVPVHVITANDYLVERDADNLAPLHAALGLRVGRITSRSDGAGRRAAYACDITYCTAKEIGFDYLRDRVGSRRLRGEVRWRADRLAGRVADETLLRGLCMAIVDEADSILIDEARVPLILSRATDGRREHDDYAQALSLSRQLLEHRDFAVDQQARRVRISPEGEQRLAAITALAATLPPAWRNRRFREEWVEQALSALHVFRRDRDYIVRDGRVEIVDATTGRVAAGRSWSRGLHQLIELKEGCQPTPAHVTAAQITFQRLFRRYHRLAGVSGTLRESASELADVYGLPVVRVPLRRPAQRRVLPTRLFADRQSLWVAVAERVAELRASGRPVLVGTDSVADSEALARTLANAGIDCRVLNARQDREEAETVALAGARAQVTVTTSMAGRGTDIPLGPGVEALGGLHVISCQHNGARRIDRQLLGRCARQGVAGSSERLLSVDSDLLRKHCPAFWLSALRRRLQRPAAQAAARLLAHLVQRVEESREGAARRRMLLDDERTERQLAFGGQME
jgi:preprotein translocase subunit SecA